MSFFGNDASSPADDRSGAPRSSDSDGADGNRSLADISAESSELIAQSKQIVRESSRLRGENKRLDRQG